MLQGKIEPGHNVLLVSGASGIVITHATLHLGRSAGAVPGATTGDGDRGPGIRPAAADRTNRQTSSQGHEPRQRGGWSGGAGSRAGGERAGRALVPARLGRACGRGRPRCLEVSRYHPADVRVLINTGIHRDGHVCEPANACYIQHGLGINVEFQGRRTLAFDLQNGGCGMLNARPCARRAMRDRGRDPRRHGGVERGQQRPPPRSRLHLSRAAAPPCSSTSRPARAWASAPSRSTPTTSTPSSLLGREPGEKRGRIVLRRSAELEDAYLAAAAAAVEEVLAADGLRRAGRRPRRAGADLARFPGAAARRDRLSDRPGRRSHGRAPRHALDLDVPRACTACRPTRPLAPGKIALLLALRLGRHGRRRHVSLLAV